MLSRATLVIAIWLTSMAARLSLARRLTVPLHTDSSHLRAISSRGLAPAARDCFGPRYCPRPQSAMRAVVLALSQLPRSSPGVRLPPQDPLQSPGQMTGRQPCTARQNSTLTANTHYCGREGGVSEAHGPWISHDTKLCGTTTGLLPQDGWTRRRRHSRRM